MMKRVFDCALAGLGLAASAPLWALLALAIKLEDGGSVFFRQARVGLNGRVFDALKFRSMVPDAEARTGPVQATENDPRITRTGRFMRSTALDELPQLWNIFAGDMSFVGPRPALFNQDDLIALRTVAGIHCLTPGLTGWAQINGRDELPLADKVRFEIEYRDRQSFWFDVKIIALTAVKVVRREGIVQADEQQQKKPGQAQSHRRAA